MAETKLWKKRVAAWRASGLSLTDFCKGKDFTPEGLGYWAEQFQRQQADSAGASEKTVRLVPVVRRPVPVAQPKGPQATKRAAAPSVPSGQESLLLLEVHGGRIAVAPGFDPQTLASVLAVLEQRSGRSRRVP